MRAVETWKRTANANRKEPGGPVSCAIDPRPMNAPFKLRPYQQEAVDATLRHFRQSDESAVIVLPTGAGKSLVIAELARLAAAGFWC